MNTKIRGLIIALAGIVLIGVGAYAVSVLFRRTVSSVNLQPTVVPVVKSKVLVTTHDMFLGDLIKTGDVNLIDVPAEVIPRDAMVKVEDVTGRYIKTDLVQGEMLLKHNLADPTNVNHDISFILADDHVLVTFPAGDLMSQNAIIERGDIIDIIATMSSEVKQLGTTGGAPSGTGAGQAQGGSQVQPTSQPSSQTDQGAATAASRLLTLDVYQAANVTALVADVIREDPQKNQDTDPNAAPKQTTSNVRAYLLALPPQDALLLKYLRDSGAQFDMMLRAPTSKQKFELTPITKEYIVELYGLGILP